MKILKSNTAITLIALIITIIVLLILAGITISMVMGENGIIAKAMLAKEKTNEIQLSEEEKLENLNKSLNGATRDDEITQLKETVKNLQSEVNNLKSSVLTTNVLYNGTAGTIGKEYDISDISSYKYILVYSDCAVGGYTNGRAVTTSLLSVSEIMEKIQSKNYYTYANDVIQSGGANYYNVNYYFTNKDKLFINNVTSAGSWFNPRIYRIEGIK